MKLFRLLSIALLLIGMTFSVTDAGQPGPIQRVPGIAAGKFKRGLRPTPRHILASAPRFRPTKAAPAQVAYVPSKLSMWLNDQYGDCVTAEEAFAKACTVGGVPGVFISDSVVKTWAGKNDLLNGADLDPVIKLMQSAGMSQDSNIYGDGAGSVVDYSNESVLQAAIAQGPVKIGIDADALPSGAGNASGWVGLGGKPGQFTNEDHCTCLCGYGPAGWLCQQLQVALPSTLQANQSMYLEFTWSTIGLVDHPWIMSTVGEAWVRNPTTIITGTGTPTVDPPLNPTPAPAPGPTPTPVPPGPTPTPIPVPAPGPITPITITFSAPVPAGVVEAQPVGTGQVITNAIAALQSVSGGVTPIPTPAPTTIEGRVGALEKEAADAKKELADLKAMLGRTLSVMESIQTAVGGKK